MNGKDEFEEMKVSDALEKFPYLKFRLPVCCLEDNKYIVRVKHNKDGSIDVEIGYPEDDFEIAA